MTRQELIDEIEQTARRERSIGSFVTIKESIPFVIVRIAPHGNEWFFQGEEATDLIDSVPKWINADDYILWLSVGW